MGVIRILMLCIATQLNEISKGVRWIEDYGTKIKSIIKITQNLKIGKIGNTGNPTEDTSESYSPNVH